jgi:hypothetical protein
VAKGVGASLVESGNLISFSEKWKWGKKATVPVAIENGGGHRFCCYQKGIL